MATVYIPSLLRKLTGGKDRTIATGKTVGEIVADLERQFPGFRSRVVEDGDLVGSIAVSINGEIGTEGLTQSVPDGRAKSILFQPLEAGEPLTPLCPP